MRLTEYAEVLTEMHEESSRLTLREMVKELDESGLRILLGAWTDAGVGKRTLRTAAENVYDKLPDAATLEEAMMKASNKVLLDLPDQHSLNRFLRKREEQDNLDEWLEQQEEDTEMLEQELEQLRQTSGNALKERLTNAIQSYDLLRTS